jgi:hypothetical protein
MILLGDKADRKRRERERESERESERERQHAASRRRVSRLRVPLYSVKPRRMRPSGKYSAMFSAHTPWRFVSTNGRWSDIEGREGERERGREGWRERKEGCNKTQGFTAEGPVVFGQVIQDEAQR